MKNTYFYKDKPLFGLNIGFSDLRVMQINNTSKTLEVQAYGSGLVDPAALKDGEIIDIKQVAASASAMFKDNITGHINTRRVAIAIPAARTFSRALKLPKLNEKELADAVRLEAEQYIPIPIDDLYLDFTTISQNEQEYELFAVAAPKKIIDSYVELTRILDLEVVAIETTIDAAARLFSATTHEHVPTVLIDFGTSSVDITIVDNVILATGTVSGGGENFTERISKFLGISTEEAHDIKSRFGLSYSDKQTEITQALDPILDQLFKEIRRMIRYYEERYTKRPKISQIVTMGGGSGMPGLSEHMTNALRLPVHSAEPWETVKFDKVKAPSAEESPSYLTVAGLALMPPKEIFS
jgi:type IV pilus assembly protein PilM